MGTGTDTVRERGGAVAIPILNFCHIVAGETLPVIISREIISAVANPIDQNRCKPNVFKCFKG